MSYCLIINMRHHTSGVTLHDIIFDYTMSHISMRHFRRTMGLEGTEGVPSRSWFDRVSPSIPSHVRTLTCTTRNIVAKKRKSCRYRLRGNPQNPRNLGHACEIQRPTDTSSAIEVGLPSAPEGHVTNLS